MIQQQHQYVGTNQYTPYNNINSQQHVGFQYPLISQQQPFQQVTSYPNPYESLPTQQQPIQSQQQLTSFINHYVSSPQLSNQTSPQQSQQSQQSQQP